MQVSVVIPCYNAAAYIEDTLRSLRAQREHLDASLQLIVVDGASTDATLEIIEGYRADLDVVISEPDNGPASAINKGFRQASGDILCWLNADDVHGPDTLARVVRFFLEASGYVPGFRRVPHRG